jgi:hypothetical protein
LQHLRDPHFTKGYCLPKCSGVSYAGERRTDLLHR